MNDRYKAFSVSTPRDCPQDVLEKLKGLAMRLGNMGYTARLGGAPDGSDQAVETNSIKVELYFPWKKFLKRQSDMPVPGEEGIGKEAVDLAKRFHPAYDKMTEVVQKMIARTSFQIMGANLRDPIKFLVCWSPDGAESSKDRTAKTGVAGQAISIASSISIPIFNLKNPDAMDRLNSYLSLHSED